MDAPKILDSAVVLRYALVTDDVRPTSNTRHLRGALPIDGELAGGELIPPAKALAIVRYPGEDNVYLFGIDDNGQGQSDTWHETVEDALAQAEYEYEGLVWTSLTV
jgi:hypothetical protein